MTMIRYVKKIICTNIQIKKRIDYKFSANRSLGSSQHAIYIACCNKQVYIAYDLAIKNTKLPNRRMFTMY